jgi:hypothetical protein
LERIYDHAEQLVKRPAAAPDSRGVDLPTTMNLVDLICRQNSNARIRFFFNIHDEDSDDLLNRWELFALVDSLLWLFCGDLAIESESEEDDGESRSLLSSKSTTPFGSKLSITRASTDGLGKSKESINMVGGASILSDEDFINMLTTFLKNISDQYQSRLSLDNIARGVAVELESAPSSPAIPSPVLTTMKSQYVLPSYYHPLGQLLASIGDNFKLTVNDFLMAVLMEPFFVEFFERKVEI